jgi:hypothetical protein
MIDLAGKFSSRGKSATAFLKELSSSAVIFLRLGVFANDLLGG